MNRRQRQERLHDIREVAEGLRSAPIEAPDFTASILDRVDVERPFLAPSVRRRLPWIRMSLGACVALTALSLALTHRWAPRAVQMVSQQPAPISDVVQCVECAAIRRVASLRPVRLNVTEGDASRLLAAMATFASISDSEGRGPSAVDQRVATVSALLPLTQAVAIDTPMPTAVRAAMRANRVSPAYTLASFRSAEPAQSVLSGASVRTVQFSADLPRVKVVPTFFEHDLDGLVLPR